MQLLLLVVEEVALASLDSSTEQARSQTLVEGAGHLLETVRKQLGSVAKLQVDRG